MKRLLLLVSLAVLTGAAPAAGDRTARAQAGGAVVFTSTRDGDSDIYAVNPDGTGLTHLTQNDVDDSEPVPSPDGRLIMFNGRTVMNADGSGQRALPGCPGFGPGGWSPDSRHIVCGGYEEGLVIVDTADGSTTPLQDSRSRRPGLRTGAPSPSSTRTACSSCLPLAERGDGSASSRSRKTRRLPGLPTPSGSPTSRRGTASTATRSGRSALTAPAVAASSRRSPESPLAGLRTDRGSSSSSSSTTSARSTWFDRTAQACIRSASAVSGNMSPSLRGRQMRSFVLYNRGRFRAAEDSDIFAVSPAGHGGRALTHPFPAGGSNFEAQWLVGPRLYRQRANSSHHCRPVHAEAETRPSDRECGDQQGTTLFPRWHSRSIRPCSSGMRRPVGACAGPARVDLYS